MLRLVLAGLVVAHPLAAQQQDAAAGYHSHAALTAALDSLARRYPRLATVTVIGRSAGGRDLHALRLAAGAGADDRPALLVVANAYGPHVVTSAAALAAARHLASSYGQDSAVTLLLDRATVYVIPRANPDAAEAMFQRPVLERAGNAAPFDDDRDQAVDEDGPEDLNGDGLITLMRIEDPAGEWTADSAEPFLLRKADPARGEAGRWRVYPEGRDNDGDEQWNEDPPGGIDVNRNLSYGYEYFSAGAGADPFDAPEARALAGYFVAHPNIAVAYVLGPQDNLLKPWEAKKGGSDREPPTGVMSEDERWFGEVASRFRQATGLEKGPATAGLEGDVLSFAYFHMGRWAWGSRAWWAPDLPADSTTKPPRGDAKEPDVLRDDRTALRWMRQHRPDGLVEWQRIQHPDFPGRVVEVGGFRPFAATNPAGPELDSTLARHARFVVRLGGLLPSVSLREARVEPVGARVYRVTVRVANEGYLPTASQAGRRVRWPRRVKVELVTAGQTVAGGRAVQLLDPLPGSGGSTELTWLVVGEAGSRLTLRASSPVAGSAETTLVLR